jgi:hypothetical protein
LSDIPPNVREIEFFNQLEQLPELPNTIQTIHIGGTSNFSINNLQHGLTKLILCDSFNQPVDNLPSTLIELFLGDKYNQPVDFLPQSLKLLYLGKCFTQSINNLPINLKVLIINSVKYKESLNNLPDSLELLVLGYHYTILDNGNFMLRKSGFMPFKNKIERCPSNLKILLVNDNYRYLNFFNKNFPSVKIVTKNNFEIKNNRK